ncbi:MAG: hypothetical protein GEU93_21030 [Propionibacteriales bacterium]|nr:hypothetical protein [Propionibacteriales bacterium]
MRPMELHRTHPRLANRLQALERQALRGEAPQALDGLRALHATIPGDDERGQEAVAAMAATLGSLGADHATAAEVCDRVFETVHDPAVRGHVQLYRGHMSRGPAKRRAYTTALGEFKSAHDARGMALALGWFALPCEGDDEVTDGYRARLGRDGIEYALRCGDPYVIALTTGHLAACETVMGVPTALDRWRAAAAGVGSDCDTLTANVVGLNYLNWALAAIGLGQYEEARRALAEGGWVIRGERWSRTFLSIESIVGYRTGELAKAAATAAQATEGARDDDRAAAMGTVVRVACDLETTRCPDTTGLEAAVEIIDRESEQVGAFAAGVLAQVRCVRREPQAHRGLAKALRRSLNRGRRFGWEDRAIALVDAHLRSARRILDDGLDTWPTGPRADAAGAYVRGMLRGAAGHDDLREAGEAFAALPEPVLAGRAFHVAAWTAPDTRTSNALRTRAVELLHGCEADRSLAKVLRDRRLRRTPDVPRVPVTQRHAPSVGLTQREHDVAVLARRGLTATEIAQELSISPGTARNHLFHIREKLGGVPKRKLVELFTPGDE